MIGNVLAFATAAILEIAGCFAFWAWLRRGASPLVVVLGVASLMGFAVVLTRVDAAFAWPRICRVWRHLHCGIARLVVVGRASTAQCSGSGRRSHRSYRRSGDHRFRAHSVKRQ